MRLYHACERAARDSVCARGLMSTLTYYDLTGDVPPAKVPDRPAYVRDDIAWVSFYSSLDDAYKFGKEYLDSDFIVVVCEINEEETQIISRDNSYYVHDRVPSRYIVDIIDCDEITE